MAKKSSTAERKLVGEPVSAKRANAIDVHIGQRMRFRRNFVRMSQEKLGELLGLTFQQVQKYEKGVNRVGAGRLYQLALALGVKPEYFYDGVNYTSPNEVPTGFAEEQVAGESLFLATREAAELNRAFTAISDPAVRRKIIELIKTLGDDGTPKKPSL